MDEEKKSTGDEQLDRYLGGGIPRGWMIFVESNPASQVELFLSKLAHGKKSVYLTTRKPPECLNEFTISDDVHVNKINGNATQKLTQVLNDVPPNTTIILDTIETFERNQDVNEYQEFINEIWRICREKNLVILLYGNPTGRADDIYHNRVFTESISDGIFTLERRINGTDVEYTFSVPKFRSNAPDETISLSLTDDLSVDTSRDIA